MGIGIKTFFQGRLARDPELRTTSDGTEVCGFCVAVNRAFQKDKENKQADFVDCVAWRGLGAAISKYFHKGDGITIHGDLMSRKWEDKEGNKRVSWEVTASDFEFPLSKSNGSGGNYEASNSSTSGASNFEEIDTTDDSELPF